MKITPVKTDPITPGHLTMTDILDKHLRSLQENSILAITSKVVSIAEGNVLKSDQVDKHEIVKQEAEYYIPWEEHKHHYTLTITRNTLIPAAGIDESNGDGYLILWPMDPQKSANNVRKYLKKRFNLKNVGVIITDSKTTPLRWGTTGIALSHSGFAALNNYIGKKDIFDRTMKVTKANIMDALAAASVACMGEGSEQTPLAIIEDIPFVQFQDRNPNKKELDDLHISIEDDIYTELLTSVKWKKGGK